MRNWSSKLGYRLGQVRQQLGFVAPLSVAEYEEVGHYLPPSALALFRTMSVADQRHSLRVCQGLQERGCTEVDMLAAALLHDVGKAQGRVPFWTRPLIVLGKVFAPRLLMCIAVFPGCPPSFDIEEASCVGTRGGCGGRWGALCLSSSSMERQHPHQDRHKAPAASAPRPPVPTHTPSIPAKTWDAHIYFSKDHRLPSWRRALSYAWYHAEVGAELAAVVGLSERTVLYIRTHHHADGPAKVLHEVDEVS